MIFAQEVEHLLGLGSLREGGVAAQIAEHDDDLAAMTFEDFLVALRDDQLRQLRREEPLQPPDRPNSSTCSATRTSRPRFSSAT